MYQLHNVLTPQPRTRPAIWRFSNAVTALAVLAQIAIPGLLFGVPSPARALESGFQNPTTNASHGGSSSAVFAPENAYALDNVDALFDDADHHLYGGFGFTVPAGTVVTGIEVSLTARCLSRCFDDEGQPTDMDFRVYVTDNNGASWIPHPTTPVTSDFGPTYSTVTRGSNVDRWGRTSWDANEISDANFLVRLSNDFHDPITPPLQEPIRGVIGVDHVQVRVHYSTPNPAVGASCGLDIALVVDSSGSIEEDELFLMQNAFEGFVDAFLPGTPSLMSVTDFDTVATLEQPFTDNAAAVKAAVNGTASGGFTNWDDALAKASSSFDPRPTKPNLLLFASDGNPNKRGHPATPAGNATDADAALAAALTRAETIKASGTRILALGIGDGLNLGNLMAIAGPAVNTGVTSDVITSSYFSLAEDLSELAASLCSGKLIIEKQLDLDGDGVPEVDGSVATPLLAGWEFQVEAADADDETVVTDQTGVIELDADAGVFSITETAGDFREDVQLLDITCLKGSQSVGAVNLASRQVTGLTLDGDDVITCTFLNGLPTFDLHGYKWHDANGNASNDCGEAVGDAQSCEPFLAGWTIFLDANGNQVLDAGEQSTITSSEPEHFGWYWFMNLPAGTYSICEAPQVGWAQTYPQGETDCHTVTLPFDAGPSTCVESSQVNAVASEQSCNFANRTVPTGTVTFEKVILGPGNPVEWSFAYQNQTFGHGQTVELNAGSGSLTESGPSGYTLVDATGACTLNGGAATLTVVEGPSTCTLINERDLGTVSGVKFNDVNANGVRDAGEAGVGGVTINLSTGPSTVTAADGSYAFPGLPTGAYTVSEVVPAGWLSTTPTSVAVTVSKGGTATANFGNRQPPTLGLTKTPSVATAAPSQDVRYTIGWSVVGNSVATNVAIVDPVPTGTTFVSIEDGGTYDAATNALTWKLGTQNPGASGIVHATLKMNSALGDGSKVVNSATIDSLETDPPFAAHATVTIVTPQVLAATAQPTLTLAKVAGQTSVNAGATLQYTVTISNIGEADAVGVTLTDSLPDGFTFTDTGEQNRVLALGVLAVGATKTITYEVTVDPETNAGRYVNTATVTADNHDGLVARASVDVRTPSVLGAVTELADTGAGSQDYVLFTIGLALLLIGRIGYGRAHRGTLDT